MVQEGKDGIEMEHNEDGVDIIKLKGAEFKIMMHSMLGLDDGKTNSGLAIPKGKKPEEIWKYFEDGCSTISTCLIEENILNSCGDFSNIINFGFCNIDPRLVIGMSHHDAHVSHERGDVDPYFKFGSVKMNYPEELLRKTAAQITGQEIKDTNHEYNEVTSYRREQDLQKITSENYGGRILPDYIVVYGESSDTHRRIAKALAKEGKPIPIIEIDREYYKDGKNWRAQQKDTQHQIDREEKSDFIKSIEDISQEER